MGGELYGCDRAEKALEALQDSQILDFLLLPIYSRTKCLKEAVSFLKVHKILKYINFPGDRKSLLCIYTEEHVEIQNEQRPM